MFPKKDGHIRGKFIAFALGGAALNLLVGGAFYAIYFTLPYHPALLFLALLAPFMIYEGLRALLPALLPAGKTDGEVLLGLLKHSSEEEISLRVYAAQAILYQNTFEQIPRKLLFEVPVVREDLPAFGALLYLRLCYGLYFQDGSAEESYQRLRSLEEYLSKEQTEEIERLMHGGPFESIKKEPLLGVRELKKQLCEKA